MKQRIEELEQEVRILEDKIEEIQNEFESFKEIVIKNDNFLRKKISEITEKLLKM